MDENEVIALYGFRSKQEYIYRTNRMREITGASELIAGMLSSKPSRYRQSAISGTASRL